MVNINRSLGLEIYRRICNPRRFVWSPHAEKIYFRDLQGCSYTITKKNDKYFVNDIELDSGEDVVEKISKIIIDRDPLFQVTC